LLSKYNSNITANDLNDILLNKDKYTNRNFKEGAELIKCNGKLSIETLYSFTNFFSFTSHGLLCRDVDDIHSNLVSRKSMIRKDLHCYMDNNDNMIVVSYSPEFVKNNYTGSLMHKKYNVANTRRWLLFYDKCVYKMNKRKEYKCDEMINNHMLKHLPKESKKIQIDGCFEKFGQRPDIINEKEMVRKGCWKIMFKNNEWHNGDYLSHADFMRAIGDKKQVKIRKDIYVWLIRNKHSNILHVKTVEIGKGFTGMKDDIGVKYLPYDAMLTASIFNCSIGGYNLDVKDKDEE